MFSTLCCTPSTSSLLYACTPTLVACFHMAFTLVFFTLLRCMIQSRPVAGSARSPNPSPTDSGFVAGRFHPIAESIIDRFHYHRWPVPVSLPTGFKFASRPVSNFVCKPVQICLLIPNPVSSPLPTISILLPASFGNLATIILLD